MGNPLWVTNDQKTDSSSTMDHPLWVAPQLEVGDPVPAPFMLCVDRINLSRPVKEAIVAVSLKLQMSCPEDFTF